MRSSFGTPQAISRGSPQEFRSFQHEIEARPGFRMPEEGLWRHDDEGLAEGERDLPAQDVEVVGRG